jgi:hypothetical protein
MGKSISFTAPPTCAAFMKSDAFFRLIAGPVGSGKTTACLFELFRRACEQAPAPDGFRYTRFAIVRSTLKQLKDTVLKDITSWLEGIAEYKVSDQTIYVTIGDVRSEWLLIPLDTPEDQRRLLSMQLTMAWMSESIEMDVGIISPLAGRCGRYPGPALGGASFFGIIADTNMPSEGSPWHKLMTEPAPDQQVFIQPGGMEPNAENLNWLTQTPETLKLPLDHPDRLAQGRTYYERFIRSNSPDWCKRYVHAQYGDDPSGTAVFGHSFKRGFHVVDEVAPVSGHTLVMGLDFGRDPCAVITQVDHRGRLLVLEEIVGEDIGLEVQVQQKIRPALMQDRYMGKALAIVGDPAGGQRSSIYEENTFDFLKRHGFHAFPAPTNDIEARLRAIDAFLMGQVDGGPMMLIDGTRCPTLVRALNGGYRYGRTRLGQRKPLPDKNEYSHIADALQYACLAAHGGMTSMITGRVLGRQRQRRLSPLSAAAWT